MAFYKRSLRNRIFFSMILLILLASVLIALVTIFQYREEAKDYHQNRLERKESQVIRNLGFVLENTTDPEETEYIPLIFKEKIYEIKAVHELDIYLYDLEGNLLKSSKASFIRDTSRQKIPGYVMDALEASGNKHFVEKYAEDGRQFQLSYSYITNSDFKPIGILHLPYFENDDFINKELKENLSRLAVAYFFMLLIAIALAYFLSKYITRSLNTVSEKIIETRLNKRNKKIQIDASTEEISHLVNAYNGMIDELESSAAQLAASEREAAWREMAKQVAHEIKNPLTPMRLTVQSFQRKFDKDDPEIRNKLNEYTDTLITQIDTMSNIASAFSNYAQMPAQKDEMLDVVKITKLALDIFNEDYIYFSSEKEEVVAKFDRSQLIRVINNLVKNSTQAIDQRKPEQPYINVTVTETETQAIIKVADNGIGVAEENKEMVFEPKFTTKTSGMGLGLAMVKNIVETYGGAISLSSEEGVETIFTVNFPKEVAPFN